MLLLLKKKLSKYKTYDVIRILKLIGY